METVNSSAHPGPVLLPLSGPARVARLVGRRARFLMDLEDGAGERFTAHTNNTGTMLGLLRPGAQVLATRRDTPGRKLPWSVEAVRPGAFWVGVDTSVPTRALRAAWAAGLLPETAGYETFKAEPRFEGGRLDALLEGPAGPLWVETKNVTLVEDCQAQFPDAPSERARKHLTELSRLARKGERAALFFCVQRPDARCFGPAWAVDEAYGREFHQALEAGVEAWAYVLDVGEDGYRLGGRLAVGGAP
ncbi:Sugar fermentation stimulation protein A [Fundidesulfovibrio magnetotacticus]|uniref:Sugar fermentation stimulation protein homolog n=1 Tax=Fundidesulfovibrio magnetotacticus TaxID=2730080 RepID=A0A6V8LMR3_9BACT|nr:DNA/RNA nuclease SfsA [Fundidesulfovibrio magnetotacticus]GFK92984.1 Sugar fermentation stimulation protein A [Fundidesulfovibrio magnetotacticus]